MVFNKLIGIFSNDLAIDLGTANTLVYLKGHGGHPPHEGWGNI